MEQPSKVASFPVCHSLSEGAEVFQAVFNLRETVLENLNRVVPAAVRVGWLPEGSDPEKMIVRWNGRLLEQGGILEEQLGSFPSTSTPIYILDARAKLQLRLRYKPDRAENPSHKLVSISPVDPLRAQLDPFFAELRKERWLRRKKRSLRFSLHQRGRQLDLDRSPAWLGLIDQAELDVEPRLVIGWPLPRRTLRGLLAVTATVLLILVALVVLSVQRPSRDVRFVTADGDSCYVSLLDAKGPRTPFFVDNHRSLVVPKGHVRFRVYPRGYPAYDLEQQLGGLGLLPTTVVLEPRPDRTLEPVTLRLSAYSGSVFDKLSPLHINHFHISPRPEGESTDYEVRLYPTSPGTGYDIAFGDSTVVFDNAAFTAAYPNNQVMYFHDPWFEITKEYSGTTQTLSLPYKRRP